MNEKRAFSITEVCASANLSRTTAYHLMKAGSLRTVKVGRRTIVLAEDLEKFLGSLPSVGNGLQSNQSLGSNDRG